MSANSLEKFRKRLVLVDYFRDRFGVEDIHDSQSVRDFYSELNTQSEGYDEKGRSYVYNFLKGRVKNNRDGHPTIKKDLLRYDDNVKRHVEKINKNRDDKIVLKNFQILSALMTEFYLDRVTTNPELFIKELNSFVEKENSARDGRIEFPNFMSTDLNKLAFWMATGSGKTLLMHINYYQYLHYEPDAPENILLVTPNEGLSRQHISEMRKSGILCQHFNAESNTIYNDSRFVKVIEITKLVEEKTGEGKSIEVSAFEGRNLVFVDEGHKGTSTEAKAWRNRRKALAEEGFTFEYSATFGQAVGTSGDVAIEEEYGKSIIYDYSYPRFYDSGYGKDYNILNLKHDFDPELTNRYLLANLLAFYEQRRCYAENKEEFYNTYNVTPPLLVFIGHTVTAGKTRSQLGVNDKRSLSDVQELVLFLHKVLKNENNWVPIALDEILTGNSALKKEDGSDLFVNTFPAIRKHDLSGSEIYTDLLERIFHVKSETTLHIVNLASVEGEIGLRAGGVDSFFGVVNIGDDSNFIRLIKKNVNELIVEDEQINASLFEDINRQESQINVLIGAKKFIEGWDSWRVSTMGLMNIGRGEGPQIIQLFGRGVRLLGKNRSLKRSNALDGKHPEHLSLLETLNIFGVRADYMAKFRDYLSEEGIDVDERKKLVIETEVNEDFQGKGLLIVRPEIDVPFVDEVKLHLELNENYKPEIDLMPQVDTIVSSGLIQETPISPEISEKKTISDDFLSLLDWDDIYKSVWSFRNSRGYQNLVFDKENLKHIIKDGFYDLRCSSELLSVKSFGGLDFIKRIVLMILRKYLDRYYSHERQKFEKRHLKYFLLDDELEKKDSNMIREYEVRVKTSAEEFLRKLQEQINTPNIYQSSEGLPKRVHFDRHLYLPLLRSDNEDIVKYTPQGLNQGEYGFVKKLREFFQSDKGERFSENREVFLLRNRSRGRGIGFLIGKQYDEKHFPDFILWLKGKDFQHIAFIDPHGLKTGGDLKSNRRVGFSKQIKEYEKELNKRSNRDDVRLHYRIISVTDIDTLKQQNDSDYFSSKVDFHREGIYFPDDKIGELLMNFL